MRRHRRSAYRASLAPDATLWFLTSWSEANQGRAPTLTHDGLATRRRGHTPWRCDIHRRPSFTFNTFVGGCVCRYQLLSELIKVIYTTRDQKVNAWALRVHTRLTDRFLAIITPMPLLQHQRSGEGDTLFNGTDRQVRGGPSGYAPHLEVLTPPAATGRRLLRHRAVRALPTAECACTPPEGC